MSSSLGTDKHLVLTDLRNKNISGRNPAKALDLAGIILNRYSVPMESGSPMNPKWIDQVINEITPLCYLKSKDFIEKISELPVINKVAAEVASLCEKFPF
ncbi:MAG: hypothetical protein JXA66_02610 [Oligoflexia bacterium]|nr:hypothetical protein [Oligoflexia bacterium]